ncbi:copper-binding protein [Phenylobacterium aquaticum]|uniref:copper-binding protein n=1 Tax=Phenylobacterium aquaticum TaxID=1763816 RepID=UPI001F5D11B1|nr:copper-binding protein [Phenylobacterium aquaticum]MCI3130780.1 copper-binding protein [Phenylobacterium aquaticum]
MDKSIAMKLALPLIVIAGLAMALPALAQYGGRGRMPQSSRTPAGRGPSRPAPRRAPVPPPVARAPVNLSDYMAYGVVEGIDAANGQVTITYQPIEVMNWPAGTKPFQVSRSKLLEGVAVGDKVGFKMESQQITQLQSLTPKPAVVREPPLAVAPPPPAPAPKASDELSRAAFRR